LGKTCALGVRCNKLNSHMTILPIFPWITHWTSLKVLHLILLTTLKPTYGSSINKGIANRAR
jgi:hypothetical protein